KQRGVWGFWTEGHNSWMVGHLNYYVRAKLMWDAEEDVRALVRDYCEKLYGQAADAVEGYIWTLERAVDDSPVHLSWGEEVPWRVILSPDVLRELGGYLEAAQAAAQASEAPEHASHVEVLRLVHAHMTAFLEADAAAGRGDYKDAVRWVDAMHRVRDEAAKVDPALIPATPEWCRGQVFSLEHYRSVYQELEDRAGGAKGKLVAFVPKEWEFRTDPGEDGQIYRWYLPGAGGRWKDIDATLYWQLQGYQDERGVGYAGKAWYRTSFQVPADAEGKSLTLTFGGIHNRGVWVWVNGLLTDYRDRHDSRRPLDVDVTGRIVAGKVNDVALMVSTPPGSERGGLYRRAFLWSRS
ncbi:MAG: DUF4838 domain-containing protein, partial [Planctomycetes bacterium]|nr:DUF4838 domain-containing protein [Planctomycetota bacterium]